MIGSVSPKPLEFSAPSESAVLTKEKPKLVFLPGFEGSPVRGAPGKVLTPEELKTYRPHWDVHFKVFDLAVPEQAEAYERLMTAAASFEWVMVFKELIPVDLGKDGSWKIGIKWGEKYLEPPETGVFIMTDDTLGA